MFLTSSLSCSEIELPEPYKSVELLPPYYHGFYSNSWQLEFLIKIHEVKTIIEVGSWLGASTMHMASLIPDDGKVYAVDHWKGSIEHQPGQQNWIPQLSYLYDQFLSNVVHAGLANKIIPYRMDSLSAAKILNFVHADLIYIDASHDTESVYADLRAWYPYVKEHGIFCGDDWRATSVQEAINRFANEEELRIAALENFWYIHK